MAQPIVFKGLKYKADHFADYAEVGDVREDKNEVDIIYTTSEGYSWVQKNFNLSYLTACLNNGSYYIPLIDHVNISVF